MIKRNLSEVKTIGTHGEGADRAAFFDRGYKWKEFKGTLVFADYSIHPGGGFPLHRHPPEEEIYYFLEGGGTMTVGKDTERVRAGDVVYVPSNEWHQFLNDKNKTTHFVIVAWKSGYSVHMTKMENGKEVDWLLSPPTKS